MGLLDDAIREHLDLKRRRGADPAEVQRAEQEALGPVHRAPHGSEEPGIEFAPEGSQPYDSGYAADEPPFEDDDELHGDPAWHDPLDSDVQPPAVGADSTQAEPELEPMPPPPAPAEPPPVAAAAPPAAAPPPPAAAAPAPAPAEPAGSEERMGVFDRGDEETVEYDVEEALGAEPERDDVLEETPEFLQDAPEHDRLWFEQKPPRDFDFDG